MIWNVLAWVGQGCFFSRFLIQWIASERARRSVAPMIFWWLSLLGSLLLGAKTIASGDAVLTPGYFINGSIYLRNIWLAGSEQENRSRLGPLPAAMLALLAAILLFTVGGVSPREGLADSALWLSIGIGGQAVWSSRFLLQWWFSERAGRSYFPRAFWWFTLVGSILNLAYTWQYAMALGEWVYFVGFLLTPIYPIRNLMLENRARRLEQ
jgi:lipid-A-disaccharide synthase-like uncharacterized protein